VKAVARVGWGMPGPLGVPMQSSRGFWLHHSVTRATADPIADARTVARIGVQRFGRLSYSWLVHPDGTILQGQDGHVGAHTRGQNSTTEAICCIGNFEQDHPTEAMCASIALIIGIRGQTLLGGHRDAPGAATLCPGKNLQSAVEGLRYHAERWEGWHNKPSWVSDKEWQELITFARNGANFPAP